MLVGKHKGFIDGKDWINTQTTINMNKQMSYRKPQKNTALLTGIIMCKKCGSPMRPRLCNNRFDENGDVKYVYSCTLKEKSRGHKCKGKNINGNKADKLLIQEIKKLIAPNEKICNELKKIINTKTSIVNENEEFIYLKAKYDKKQSEMKKKQEKDRKKFIEKNNFIDIKGRFKSAFLKIFTYNYSYINQTTT